MRGALIVIAVIAVAAIFAWYAASIVLAPRM